jgi:hypothetical protein
MVNGRRIAITVMSIFLILLLSCPIEITRFSEAIDVSDGTLSDWANATVQLSDPLGDSPVDMTDLVFVAFDFDDTWLYVRWDIDNDGTKASVLYDMGINITASGTTWDIYMAAQIERIAGTPTLTNISIRDASDAHIWNASDDGNMAEDGTLYFDPPPGGTPGTISVEARFPLSCIVSDTGLIFSQFRSHSSIQVTSNVKDFVPDSGYVVLSVDGDPPELANLTDFPDPQSSGGNVNITVDVTDNYNVDTVWVNITYPNGSWTNVSMLPGSGNGWYYNTTYIDTGIYSYTVWANDSSDNWNSTGPGTFMITGGDTIPPELMNLNDFPDPQSPGGFVNITVDVTDDTAVDQVWVNITYPNGSWNNVSMLSGAGDGWYYNTTYPDIGIHSYTIFAKDISNNWNSTGPGTFMISDINGPEFTNLNDTPDPQENGGYVNITVDVTDAAAVGEVWVNITFPDASWVNVTMLPGSGNVWFYNTTYLDLGVHSYTIWANDTSNNWNSTGPGTFTIQDLDGPEFSNLDDTPDPQENEGYVNITVDVTDNVGVDEVWVNITYPDATWTNVSMDKGTGDGWYYNTTYTDLGVYSYTAWANDTSDIWNSTSPGTFTIQDNDGPEFTNLDDSPDPQLNGGYVNITVDVIDDMGVDEVWLNITYPNATWINVSMQKGTGNGRYYNTSYPEIGVHSYTVWANDTSNNWNNTGPGSFTIQDTDSPTFTNPDDTPDPQENNGYVNITVNVMDDVGVQEVWVNISYPNGSWVNISMIPGTGNDWYFNTSYSALGIYSYTIWANDTSNNWNGTTPGTFTIQDTDGPVLTNLDDAPDPQENGGFVNITVEVIDDVGVDEVWVNITYPDGTWINISMDRGAGDEWYHNSSFADLGVYSYTVWANDTSNNWNGSGPQTFTIQDTQGPEFNDLKDAPDPQEIGGYINITVNVTDVVGVDEAWVNITYPNGSWINTSMLVGSGDGRYYNSTFIDQGIYSYTVWANDTNNNWNSTGPQTFQIKGDATPPLLWNLNDFPDPQELGGFVNITVNILDDIALDEVWVNITYPNGSWVNISMTPGAGNGWFHNTTYGDSGLYSYKVWANDTSNNWNTTGPGTFRIRDINDPDLSNLNATPNPQENDGYVNITVDVTDDVAVGGVWVNITYPNGSWNNVIMEPSLVDGWYYNTTYAELGIHSYIVWANDTSNNWNSSGPQTFTIQDTDGPVLTNLDDTPDPQENEDYVNITVDVTDDMYVDEVWVNITYPDGSWVNISMDKGVGDEWYYSSPYSDLGIYSYTVWANDTSNNWNGSGLQTFTIQDTDGPVLTNIDDTPDPQEVGGFVNITVDVLDDIAVDRVWANITYPNGTWINISMEQGPGNGWYYNTTYTDLGIHNYTIWANDTIGNWNSASMKTFEIKSDIIPPVIWNLTDFPDPQKPGGFVNITASATDDTAVGEVWINVTYPNGTWINVTMKQGMGNEWYFNTTYAITGLHLYTVWANDTSNNWNVVGPGTFQIQDINLPEFDNLADTPDPQENGGNVNITVDVTDDVSVGGVWIYITYPDGSWVNTSMIPCGGDEWYFNTIYGDLGQYSYTAWANDTSNNWNSTSPGIFTIQDTDGPQLTNIESIPATQIIGGYVNLSVNVFDDVAVYEVWVNVTYPDGGFNNVSMIKGIGDEWFYNITYGMPGTYSYTVYANDTSDNWNNTILRTFEISGFNAPPELWNLMDFPDPQDVGGFVNITVNVTDDVGVDEVWVNIIYPNSAGINASMLQGIGDIWFYTRTFTVLDVYTYTVWAKDTSNQWNSSGPEIFTIHDIVPPTFDNLNDIPDPQENGGYVNISVTVMDDVAVDEVLINIRYPNGTWLNRSLRNIGVDEWYLRESFTNLGLYIYSIWARDTSNNWNNSAPGSFIIQDTDGPEIKEPEDKQDNFKKNEEINITVDVIDDVGIDEIWINISFPSGIWLNVSMARGTGNEWYYNDKFDNLGNYTYTIWAVDTSGNWNSTDPEIFSIEPDETPEKPSRSRYMVLWLFYWPLILILFTIVLMRRYEPNNRFKRHAEPIASALINSYNTYPKDIFDDITRIQDIISLSIKMGIPVEEFILARLFTDGASQIEGDLSKPLSEELKAIKTFIGENKGIL